MRIHHRGSARTASRRTRQLAVGLLWAAAAAVGITRLTAADADLILHGGKIVTADAAFSVAEAVAIKAGRIVAVGTSRDVLARERGTQTQLIDLQGRTVLPGLIDSHTHPPGAALSELTTEFAVIRSFDDIRAYIRRQAAKTPKGEWIHVPKTFPARLKEMRMPTRDVLDATLEHPVFYDASYANAVNSHALKMSGITRDTPDPPHEGARIIKDKNGEPNGILTGRATELAEELPRRGDRFTDQQRLDALEAMLKRYAAAGLTGVTDRGVREDSIQAYNTLKAAGRLPIRVVMTYRPSLEELKKTTYRSGQGDQWLKFGSFKVGLDGGINAGTSFMREPWQPYAAELFGFYDPKMRGDLRMPFDELAVIMRVAWEQGWPLSAHSQGVGRDRRPSGRLGTARQGAADRAQPLAPDSCEFPVARHHRPRQASRPDVRRAAGLVLFRRARRCRKVVKRRCAALFQSLSVARQGRACSSPAAVTT